ncbi:nucleotidyltransferase family protein [Sulfurimonas sp.]
MKKINVVLDLCSLLKPSSTNEINILKNKILENKFPWYEVIAIANKEYLIPSLYISLKEKKLFKIIQDKQLQEYLHAVYSFNLERNQKIIYQIKDVLEILKSINVTPLLLKGSVSLLKHDYDDLGMRHLTDIDMLITDNQLTNAYNALVQSGYSYVRKKEKRTLTKNFHHLEPISKEGMPTSLELHRTILGKQATNYMLHYSQYSIKLTNPELLNANILTPTYRLYHAFLHTELQDNDHKLKRLALRHLFDFTVLARQYDNEINWELFDKLIIEINCKKILNDYLYVANILFSLNTPLTITTMQTKKYYLMIKISWMIQETRMRLLFPLSVQIPRLFQAYSYKRLQKTYLFNSFFGYLLAILKHINFHYRQML